MIGEKFLMKLIIDQEADAWHFRLVDVPVTESDEIAPGGFGALEAPSSDQPDGFPIPD